MFTPWKGSRYKAAENSPATLILGESHYGEDYPHADKTIRCIQNQINGHSLRFFTRVAAAFLGHLPSRAEKAVFWHSVAYHNLITTPLRASRVPPSTAQWDQSLPTLQGVISDLGPELIVVLGKRMWPHIAALDCLVDFAAPHPPGMSQPKQIKGGSTVVIGITHPSGRGFRWTTAHEQIQWGRRMALR